MVKEKFDKTSSLRNTVFSHVMFCWRKNGGGERGKGTTNAREKKKGTSKETDLLFAEHGVHICGTATSPVMLHPYILDLMQTTITTVTRSQRPVPNQLLPPLSLLIFFLKKAKSHDPKTKIRQTPQTSSTVPKQLLAHFPLKGQGFRV